VISKANERPLLSRSKSQSRSLEGPKTDKRRRSKIPGTDEQ
jgi:hypothetical protein